MQIRRRILSPNLDGSRLNKLGGKGEVGCDTKGQVRGNGLEDFFHYLLIAVGGFHKNLRAARTPDFLLEAL